MLFKVQYNTNARVNRAIRSFLETNEELHKQTVHFCFFICHAVHSVLMLVPLAPQLKMPREYCRRIQPNIIAGSLL